MRFAHADLTVQDIITKEQEWAKKALERRGHVLAGSEYLDDLLNLDHHILSPTMMTATTSGTETESTSTQVDKMTMTRQADSSMPLIAQDIVSIPGPTTPTRQRPSAVLRGMNQEEDNERLGDSDTGTSEGVTAPAIITTTSTTTTITTRMTTIRRGVNLRNGSVH